MNRDLPELEYVDYVAAEIYRDERAEAKRWMYQENAKYEKIYITGQEVKEQSGTL